MDATEAARTSELVLVSNAAAGSADADAVDAALDVLGGAGKREVEHVRTETPDDLDGVVRRLDGRRLVVAGGDGSLHAVVAALHRADRLSPDDPLGLVPLGTGNDLARALGLPLDPAEAARTAVAGRPRSLDLLVDDRGGVVVNAVHLGVGADAAARAASWKSGLGSAAYALGALVAGTRVRGWRLEVDADGRRVADVDRRVLMVGVGNGTSVGGGTPLTPDASPDDGLADVVVSFAVGPLARVGYALRLRRGDHVQRGDVVAVRAAHVAVRGDAVPVNADGELPGPVRAREWRVRPGAWSLLVPA